MDGNNFLQFVGDISEGAALKMDKEKITPELVHVMSDEELSAYLPVHGDRLRLRQYLKPGPADARKKKLLQILHRKLDKAAKGRRKKGYASSSEEDEDGMRRQYGNRNAVKGSRLIEVGWIHKSYSRTKQVRSRTGGGTRKVCIKKDSNKKDILNEAVRLFFPNGASKKGCIDNFETDLWDFSKRKVNENVTIQDMYDETKMPILRFYLATAPKSHLKLQDSSEIEQDNDMVAEAMSISGIDGSDDKSPDVLPLGRSKQHTDTDLLQPGTRNETNNTDTSIPEIPELHPDIDLPELQNLTEADFSAGPVTREVKIRVHRGQVLQDLIKAFKPIDIENTILSFEVVRTNGTVELAEDGGGVTRDTLSEFWNAFYDQCTLGTEVNVPCLRHDFGESDWAAVGKILRFGWHTHGYFRVSLARPFMEQCIYGKHMSSLSETFYRYIPSSEAATLKSAITNFEEVDFEELIDVMAMHDSRKIPTKDTLPLMIEEIGHKELVQSPMFVCDCLIPVVKSMVSISELDSIYGKLDPTAKCLVRVISFPDNMTVDEATVSNHLKRFVRELRPDKLRRFTRFCTGSDLLINDKITVTFVNVTGLARGPVSHTCSCLLELPKQFDTYMQFRSEFNAILESNYWEIDFI